ncbi:MAG: alpha/beta fold hydrolase, partial [Actinomycetota bacterium]|nr:alpha/beta fold hydrolase [Actinomycetota bacterium]
MGTLHTTRGDFEAIIAGPQDGPVVVLLHGFPELNISWKHQIPALADAGYRVLAPNQRGYAGSVRDGS